MTLSLSYNDDLSRVQINATDLPGTDTVTIERSINNLLWTTVRGAGALTVEGGAVSADDYEFVADQENFYRVSGGLAAGLNLPGAAGSYASAPETGQSLTGAASNSVADGSDDPAVAPSVDASAPGLLVCAWTSFEHTTPPYVPQPSMAPVAQLSGETYAQCVVATETLASGGATGTRSASSGESDPWSSVSVAVPGATAVEDVQAAAMSVTPGPEVTTASAEAGWWLVAICAVDYDTNEDLGAPSGGGWTLLAASPGEENCSRTMAWAREVTDPGPQTVALGMTGWDTFLTVLLVSGVEVDPGLNVTGVLDARVEFTPREWPPAMDATVAGKYGDTADERSWRLDVLANGGVRLRWSTDGVVFAGFNSTNPLPGGHVAARGRLETDIGGQHRVTFYSAPSVTGPWSQLGHTHVGAGATSIYASTAGLEVGARDDGTKDPFDGVVHAAEVRNAVRTIANVVFTDYPTGTEEFVDQVGNEWSVHGDARIIGGTIFEDSITPSLGGKAWLKSIRHPFLNRPIHRTLAGGGQDIGRGWRGGIHEVQGRSAPIAVTDVRSSREFVLTVQVPDEQAAAEMDLILASGDVFFLQVPPELASHMTGGYVRIGATTQHRIADTIMWRFTLPCKVIAPPGPGVVGSPLTWGTVFNLYGSYEAMWAANPTWASLLSTVGSPDDLVVLP